jgi:hypothetical protein
MEVFVPLDGLPQVRGAVLELSSFIPVQQPRDDGLGNQAVALVIYDAVRQGVDTCQKSSAASVRRQPFSSDLVTDYPAATDERQQ